MLSVEFARESFILEYTLNSLLMRYLTFLFLFLPVLIYTQPGIYGFLPADLPTSSAAVSLYQVELQQTGLRRAEAPLTTVDVSEGGSFQFSSNQFPTTDWLYQLVVEIGDEALVSSPYFFHSQGDTLLFVHDEEHLIKAYQSTNTANWEWKRWQAKDKTQANQGEPLKNYVKDSLKILLVKLVGLRELADQALLSQDIEEHGTYYAGLLLELRQSDLPPSTYYFLEREMDTQRQAALQKRLYWSRLGNVLAMLVALVGAGFWYYQ